MIVISQGVIAGLIVMLCWGCSDFILTIPIRKIGTLKTILIRNIMSILLVAPVGFHLFFTDRMAIPLLNLLIILTSSLLFILAYYFFMKGFEIGSISLVSPIGGAYSIITVMLALMFLGETLSNLKLLAVSLMILGVFFTSSDITKLKNIKSQKGLKEAILAMVGFGLSMFVLGFVSKLLDSIILFAYATLSQAFFFVVLSILKGGRYQKGDLNIKLFLIFVLQATIVNVGWFAYIYGVGQDLVSIVTPISSLLPGVTVILALIFYKEKLVLNQKLGIFGILAGVYLISI
jgi:bacterial/archaeal transporter family protein